MNELTPRERRYLDSLEALNPSPWLQERIDLERREARGASQGMVRGGKPIIGFRVEPERRD